MPFLTGLRPFISGMAFRVPTSDVSVVLSADHKRAMVHCPPWPGQSPEQSYDVIMPLR